MKAGTIEIIVNVVIGISMLAFFIVGYYLGETGWYASPTYNNLDSTTDIPLVFGEEMSATEITSAKELVSSLSPIYTVFVKEVYFGKNASEMKLDSYACMEYYKGCGGLNNDNGNITVSWAYGSWGAGIVLCHELLHDYILTYSNKVTTIDGVRIYEDPKHQMIDNLAQRGVCYL